MPSTEESILLWFRRGIDDIFETIISVLEEFELLDMLDFFDMFVDFVSSLIIFSVIEGGDDVFIDR